MNANFEVLSPGEVRLALLTTRIRNASSGTNRTACSTTGWGRRGSLSFQVPHPDDYDIVVDNREGKRDVRVRVRVSLDFGPAGPEAVTAAPARQLTAVVLSFLFFFGVVTYSARRILRAIGR